MKPKKLRKKWKSGEVWERGTLYNIKGLLKRHLKLRTCRFKKHKKQLTITHHET